MTDWVHRYCCQLLRIELNLVLLQGLLRNYIYHEYRDEASIGYINFIQSTIYI